MAVNKQPGLSEESVKKAKTLGAYSTPELSIRDITKASVGHLQRFGKNIVKTVETTTDRIIPDNPEERSVRDAESHVRRMNRSDKVRYGVSQITGGIGSIVKGTVVGLRDSLNENIFSKPPKGARTILDKATHPEEPVKSDEEPTKSD